MRLHCQVAGIFSELCIPGGSHCFMVLAISRYFEYVCVAWFPHLKNDKGISIRYMGEGGVMMGTRIDCIQKMSLGTFWWPF